ncbi:MAG: hypothetical protein H6836_06120 [Planctomycetes bacterium]|nr:hypothetical protein [Planctomycetota bacterium]MCB9889136.1 hypothetical protein [Planctomycetota bacterium]
MPHQDAFLLMQAFRRCVLPGLLRKLHLWKGLHTARHRDIVEDIEQELWLDCLLWPEEIVGMTGRDRHTRWFRIVERSHYRLHTRSERLRASDTEPDAVCASASSSEPDGDAVECWGGELPPRQQQFLRQLGHRASYLKNGRLNCSASARSLGVRPQQLRAEWGAVADQLGFDAEFEAFWCRRLVEALVGLAADLLRDSGSVALCDERERRAPDPLGRLRRVRALRQRMALRPIPTSIKRVLAHYHSRNLGTLLTPLRILRDAASVLPDDPTVQLWTFEAALAEGLPDAAARAIRRARAARAEAVPVLLARARLLESRGKATAARRLLQRGPVRDRRVSSAIVGLAG